MRLSLSSPSLTLQQTWGLTKKLHLLKPARCLLNHPPPQSNQNSDPSKGAGPTPDLHWKPESDSSPRWRQSLTLCRAHWLGRRKFSSWLRHILVGNCTYNDLEFRISEVITYQPRKARLSPEKMPTPPSAFASVTRKIFLRGEELGGRSMELKYIADIALNYINHKLIWAEHPNCNISNFGWAPFWNVSNITGVCQWRFNSDHMLKSTGEGEVKATLGKRLERRRSFPARLLS